MERQRCASQPHRAQLTRDRVVERWGCDQRGERYTQLLSETLAQVRGLQRDACSRHGDDRRRAVGGGVGWDNDALLRSGTQRQPGDLVPVVGQPVQLERAATALPHVHRPDTTLDLRAVWADDARRTRGEEALDDAERHGPRADGVDPLSDARGRDAQEGAEAEKRTAGHGDVGWAACGPSTRTYRARVVAGTERCRR